MVLCPVLSGQKRALLATVLIPNFTSLFHNAKTAFAVQDIKSNQFWTVVYCLLSDVFPGLRALKRCDANKTAMDKIFISVIGPRMPC